VEALFDQTGVIRAATLEELFDVAVLLAHQPLPRGNQVAVVANSAGVATLLADACEAHGLELGGAGVVNLGAFTSAVRYEETVRDLLLDDTVDAVVVAFACVGDCSPDEVAAGVGSGVQAAEERSGTAKPVLVCIMGAQGAVTTVSGDRRRVLPAYRFPESAPRALARVVRYAELRRQPPGRLAWYDGIDPTVARCEVQDAIAREGDDPVRLEAEAAARVLQAFGLRTGEGEGRAVAVRIRPDPLFGPIIEIEGAEGRTLVRLTPLTDRDIAAVLEQTDLERAPGVGEVLGRLSQLVEELPWVWSLEASAVPGEVPLLAPGPTITVRRVSSSQTIRP
jgi:acyl-CoA synthetase (NDP forming)